MIDVDHGDAIELRCPGRDRKLFVKLSVGQLEFACADCRRAARHRFPTLRYVVHVYSIFSGVLLDTVWLWNDGTVTKPEQPKLAHRPEEAS